MLPAHEPLLHLVLAQQLVVLRAQLLVLADERLNPVLDSCKRAKAQRQRDRTAEESSG